MASSPIKRHPPALARVATRGASASPQHSSQVNHGARQRMKGFVMPENHLPASIQTNLFLEKQREVHLIDQLSHLGHGSGQSAKPLQEELQRLKDSELLEEDFIDETQTRILAAITDTSKALGEGTFGKVARASIRLSSASSSLVDVAVKVIKVETNNYEADLESIKREIGIHHHLSQRLENGYCHPNITPLFYDTVWQLSNTKEIQYALIMPFAPNKTMRAVIDDDLRKKRRSNMDFEKEVLWMLSDLLSGLDFMHSQGLINADLKPENVLAFAHSDGRRLLKLTDFGLSANTGWVFTIRGTPNYVAPELLHPDYNQHQWKRDSWQIQPFNRFSPKQDYFSLGVMLFELAFEANPPDYVLPISIGHRLKREEYQKCTSTMNKRLKLLHENAVHQVQKAPHKAVAQASWACLWNMLAMPPESRNVDLLRHALRHQSFGSGPSSAHHSEIPCLLRASTHLETASSVTCN